MQNKKLFPSKAAKPKLNDSIHEPGTHGKANKFYWQSLHQKTIQVAGRGGKGHTIGSANHSWNRKGRW